jgi:hypothetical protein
VVVLREDAGVVMFVRVGARRKWRGMAVYLAGHGPLTVGTATNQTVPSLGGGGGYLLAEYTSG